MLNILVLNKLAERHREAITTVSKDINLIASTLKDASQYIADADILVTWGWMDITNLLSAAKKLKWIHALSAGVEKLIIPPVQASHVILTNSKGIHSIPVSEHVLALMLCFSRGLNFFIRHQQKKVWKRAHVDEIYEKTIGIVGLGSIGREIAKKSKNLGMTVLATKREMTSELFVDKLYPADAIMDMLSVSDFVIVALPLVPETKEFIKLEHFQAMKPSAYFINIARGQVVREEDLITALKEGFICGAGLDVFTEEPLPETSPLWDMPNVIITPHLAALSPCYMDRAVKLFADELARFIQQGEMFNMIDKQKGY